MRRSLIRPLILSGVLAMLAAFIFAAMFDDTRIAEQNFREKETSEKSMHMTIDGTAVTVDWENNASVSALKALAEEAPLTIQMSMYGGFEQVGSIGSKLVRNDVQTITQPGDIVLYSGDQIVVFYGSNSWSYTRLGRITDKSAQKLTELLGHGDVSIKLYLK